MQIRKILITEYKASDDTGYILLLKELLLSQVFG